MKINFVAKTHVGLKRNHNEDSFLALAEQGLFLVADGMGGHNSGEVASRLAVETVEQFFRDTSDDEEMTWPFKEDRALGYEENRICTAIKLANLRIFEMAKSNNNHRGMGTTAAGVYFGQKGSYVSHVGDSRVYRVRNGQIEQLTEDHSLLNDYLKFHQLSAEEIENFPHKNVIVRALGMKDLVQVDLKRVETMADDIYVVCSDGLSGMVSDAQIEATAWRLRHNPEAIANELIDLANEGGGVDNITVIVAELS